ncbi:unnamed protein product, partial [marine sediment metagenome]
TYSRPVTLATAFSLGPIGARPALMKGPTDLRYVHQNEIIDYFYEIVILNRHYYLSLFYKSFFEFPDPRDFKWSGDIRIKTPSVTNKKNSINVNLQDLNRSLSIQKNDKSRIMVRNLFHKEILDETKVTNTVKAKVSFWQTLDNLYNHLKLEDRFFAPSSIGLFLRDKNQKGKNNIITPKKGKEVNYNNLFYLCQQYQPKASILNPYSVHWFLNNIFSGKRLFTPVLSWCSYLIAFMHSDNWTDYVGVDVMPKVCQKAAHLADWYHQLDPQEFGHKKVEILCQPSESLLKDTKFLKKYDKWFDSILVCPPYWDMEIYQDGEQSLKNYPVYEDWLEKYWHQTVQVCAKVLKRGGLFGVIANDYYSLDGIHYPLPKDFDSFTSKYFKLVETYFLYNRTSPLRVNHKDRTERLFVYTI